MSTENTQNTPRVKINWLLILQGWAMLWVVIGHASLSPDNPPAWETTLVAFAYTFHMQLFVLVSGWLFNYTRLSRPDRWTYGATVKEKLIRLALPGLVFSVLALLLKMAFPGDMSRTVDTSFGGILHGYLYPHENPFAELWFIAVLLELFLLMPLWRLALKNPAVKFGLLAVLLVLPFVFQMPTRILSVDRLVQYAFWFYLGIVMNETDVVEKGFKGREWIMILAGTALYAAGCLIPVVFAKTLGAILFAFGLALLLDKILPRALSTFRDYTYQIFLMGIFAQIFVKMLHRRLDAPYLLMFAVCVAAGVYVPVLVSKIAQKINWKPLLLCLGLKYAPKK